MVRYARPLDLQLNYLLTASADELADEHEYLALGMKAFLDHPRIAGDGLIGDSFFKGDTLPLTADHEFTLETASTVFGNFVEMRRASSSVSRLVDWPESPCAVAASPGAGYPPISSATAVAASTFRSLTTTRAPAAASPRASARPIPEPAPVTTTPAPAISMATPAGYRDADHPIKAVPGRSGRSPSR